MKFRTNITEYNNNPYYRKRFKSIDGLLYNIVMNQTIKLICDGRQVKCKVVNVEDSVYEDAIYRYIEVIIINE